MKRKPKYVFPFSREELYQKAGLDPNAPPPDLSRYHGPESETEGGSFAIPIGTAGYATQRDLDAELGRKHRAIPKEGRKTQRKTQADSDAAAQAVLRLYDEITARGPNLPQGEKYRIIRKTIGKKYGHTPSLPTIYRALRRARKLPAE